MKQKKATKKQPKFWLRSEPKSKERVWQITDACGWDNITGQSPSSTSCTCPNQLKARVFVTYIQATNDL